ncbi:putative non-hemolytic phospholipase C precursor [Neohortaea acidophila]|uniref:Putative non-hemolytic phospholipase C n=1 Tax=Neohortaea acidophila TaxID=245834 RepID=A0A6A6PT86_9PEZI|nr:putative non-hemolytic phospholipase C precursor [Neohortaea acidophila]KAF2482894.1 putative non-hemolytic phospholipase C precursor [Neohortaea acidophila]
MLFLFTLAAASLAAAGSIQDVEHIVLFMQENRAFDHYFGTMAGIRGFKDPNVQVNNGTPVWYQNVDAALSTKTDSLLPWYLNYLGGTWENATQCMEAGSNGWSPNQAALNHDLNNDWATQNTPWSWAHFTRAELPNHFAIAEGWTVGDMYQQAVITSTNPNRVVWASGTINEPDGGVYIDNNETPGCESPDLNCYPLTWETTAQLYENAGVTWQVYQDTDNFDDNPLAWFQQFQQAPNGSALNKQGMSYIGLESFYKDAAAGTLPQVSYIIGPAELSEHPPYQPKDGAWLQQKIVDTVTSSPLYNNTVLIISYDETGGWGDHVVPYHSPSGTPGEWIQDPYGEAGYVYTGPGFRLPFYIISPWTRGGYVYTGKSDHNSQIKFVEEVFAAKGKNVKTPVMNAWRREFMSDLTLAFDFEHPDYSIPSMPNASYPSTNSKGQWNGYAVCEAKYPTQRPPVPYGQQNVNTALETEEGFKAVRGELSEGRYLTFEMNGYALTDTNGKLTATKATSTHNTASQRFVVYEANSTLPVFTIKSAQSVNSTTATVQNKKSSAPSLAGSFQILDMGNGTGYSVQQVTGKKYLSINKNGAVQLGKAPAGFSIFSVTYNS